MDKRGEEEKRGRGEEKKSWQKETNNYLGFKAIFWECIPVARSNVSISSLSCI